VGRKYRDERLYDRGGRFIWARVRDEAGRIIRVSTRARDEKAATLFANEWERRAVDPSYRRAAEATLGSAIVDWFAELQRRKVSAATYSIAQTKAGHFVRLWGVEWPLLRVTGDAVLQYIDTREGEGVKPFTVKKELGALRGVLEQAKFRGSYPTDLATVFPPHYSGQHRPRSRAPSQPEVVALLRQLHPVRAAHLAFVAGSGARLAESYRAHREDVDLEGLLVRIRGSKTELASGLVPITGLTRDLLVFALQHAPGKTVLFEPWGKLHRDVAAACVRAGIDRVSPNDLRRAFGSWHRKAGLTAEQVSILLRHTTDKLAQTTYAKIGGEHIADDVRKLVPIVYADGSSDDPQHPQRQGENSVNLVPPVGIGPTTLGLGSQWPTHASSARSIGNKLAQARRRLATIVPNLDEILESRAIVAGDDVGDES